MTRIVVVLTAWMLTVMALAPVASAEHKPSHQAPLQVTHRHFLEMYKVERVIDLEGDGLEVIHNDDSHAYCDNNDTPLNFTDDDLATDGMWKVVDVDQDETGKRPYTDVKVYASYADASQPSKWHFEFENRAEGRAQLKLYVTCLGWKTAPNSHQHQWTWTGHHTQNHPNNAHPAATQDSFASVNQCGPGHIAVAPGFQWDRTKSVGDIYRSGYSNASFNSWTWGFYIEPGSYDLTLTFRCLQIKSLFAGSPTHLHKLMYDFETGPAFSFPPPNTSIAGDPDMNGPIQSVETRLRNCDSHEKGMVHYFNLEPVINGQHNLWFLGMDPRIKSRAYKVLNTNAAAQNAHFGLMCFNDRTDRRQKN